MGKSKGSQQMVYRTKHGVVPDSVTHPPNRAVESKADTSVGSWTNEESIVIGAVVLIAIILYMQMR